MKIINLCLFIIILNIFLSKKEIGSTENVFRSLEEKNKPKAKAGDSAKQNSKLLQTLYSDSYSNNYYYTTLYISDKQIKQTYLIDTGSAIMSSPCAPCENCGKQKKIISIPLTKRVMKH